MTLLRHLLLLSLTWLGLLTVLVMAIDALEYEITGQCRDCVVLPHLSERFPS